MNISADEPTPGHDCGLCDGPLTFEVTYTEGPYAGAHGYRCDTCGWTHLSTDCCDGMRSA